MGKPAAAEPFFQKSLEIRRRVLGDANMLTASSLVAIAGNLYLQGKLAEAEGFRMSGPASAS